MYDIQEYLEEDIGYGDITSDFLVQDQWGMARIHANQECVLAGLEEAMAVFTDLGVETFPLIADGTSVSEGETILHLEGPLRSILLGERLALNFLMRMSGIATVTREVTEKIQKINQSVRVAATRKTTPGFRKFEKKAVILGGGDPHRFKLDDMILIKDNHLRVVGDIGEAISMAREASFTKKIDVEVETLEQAAEAAEAGEDIIMLDNMSPEQVGKAYETIKRTDSRIVVEVSGGINPDNVEDYAPFADIISMGWLTHSVEARHYSLNIVEVEELEEDQ